MTWAILKLIAIISMTLDHAIKALNSQTFLIKYFGMSLNDSYLLLVFIEGLGRLAFPIFAYGIVQGCTYTRDRKKYLIRLLIFAICSEIPYQLALSGVMRIGFTNVFFTLLLGALSCFIFDFFKKKDKVWIAIIPIIAIIFLAQFLKTDYAGFGVIFIIVPYMFSSKTARLISLGAVVAVFYGVYTQFNGITFGWLRSELLYVVCLIGGLMSVVLLFCYNGEKGKGMKWFFYTFYPLHLIGLYIASRIVTL